MHAYSSRILFIASNALAAVLMHAETPMPAEKPQPLRSHVFAWDSLTPKPTPVGIFRRVADQPTAMLEKFECHVTTLNAGEKSHPPHHHPQEEFIVLQDGTLDVFINGHVHRVGPGSVFFFASNDVHNVTNVGRGPATYFVFNVMTAATRHVPAQPAAESAPPADLRSSVFDWAALPVKTTATGERRDIIDSPTVTCAKFEAHVTTLNPGQVPHSAHRHPHEEIILVKEGTLDVTINGVEQRAGPGAIVFCASGDEHGVRNAGTMPATYYIIRIVAYAAPAKSA